MRVITAIYLHCRPELRDEWLAGMHESNVEGEVEESLPTEWALRGLTFWWLRRCYGDVLKVRGKREGKRGQPAEGVELMQKKGLDGEGEGQWQDDGGQEIEDDERDFFQRELDAMGWGMAGLVAGDEVGFGEEAPGVNGQQGQGHTQNISHPTSEPWETSGPLNMEGW